MFKFKYITYLAYIISILVIIFFGIHLYYYYQDSKIRKQFVEGRVYTCKVLTMIDFNHSTLRKVKGKIQLLNSGHDLMARGYIETSSPFNKVYIHITPYTWSLREATGNYWNMYIIENNKAKYKINMECE